MLRSFAELGSAQDDDALYLGGSSWQAGTKRVVRALGGLFAAGDRGGAFAAGFAVAFVGPEIFFAVGAAGGAAESGVGDDLVAGIISDVGLEMMLRAVPTRQSEVR